MGSGVASSAALAEDDVGASAASPIRVVFADDSAAIRTLARHALSGRAGFALVAQAADGIEALKLAEIHRPDCVVLDIEMPGMGGFAALAELRERLPTVPVVMLSGFSDETVTARALAGGAAAYLDKSSQLMLLAETIRRVASRGASRAAGEAALDRFSDPSSPDLRPEVSPDLSTAEPAAIRPVASVRTAPEGGGAAAADLRRLEYVISHDLGEPLRIMSGFATLLRNGSAGELDSGGQAFLTHIVDGARRMQAMIDDLLGYSRAGRCEPRADLIDLNDVVAAVFADLHTHIREIGATVSAGDLPRVLGDRNLLTTVLRHLVANGLTFNRAAEPTVHIGGGSSGRTAVVTVTDNGIGVAEAKQELIFDLFQRLNTREEFPGTGTGLALCRRLVGLQGGTIELDSSTSEGSTFRLFLACPRTDDATYHDTTPNPDRGAAQ